MRIIGLGLFFAGVGLLACTSKGAPDPTDDFMDAPSMVEIAPDPGSSSAAPAKPKIERYPDPADARWASIHHNITVLTDDPTGQMARVRTTLADAGAEIQNANAQADNANLNATADAKAFARVRRQLEELGGFIQSENSSRNDMGPQIRQLRDRLELIDRAEAQLQKLAAGPDPDTEAVLLQRELNMRERQNIDNQIRSYWQQAGKTYIYISFQKPPR